MVPAEAAPDRRQRRVCQLAREIHGDLACERHVRAPVAGEEAPAGAPVGRGQLGRWAIAREDELAAGLIERVEGVEELLAGLCLRAEELDVVDQEDVCAAKAALEARGALAADGVDELARERLERRVADRQAV